MYVQSEECELNIEELTVPVKGVSDDAGTLLSKVV